MSTSSALANRQTIVELVTAYERAAAGIRVGFARIARAENELTAAFDSGEFKYTFSVRDRHNRGAINFDDPEPYIKQLEREVWRALVERLEVRRMCSIKRAAEIDRQLEREELPELTVENVAAWAKGIRDNLGNMLQEAVEEVFDWLRPHGHRYKTNSEFEIGRKVILTWMLDTSWGYSQNFRVNYNYHKYFVALENVFTGLDGKGTIAKGSHQSKLADAINTTPIAVGHGETEYFKFRCFKNRNLHLEFKRADLVAELNKLAGGMRLREKRGEAA